MFGCSAVRLLFGSAIRLFGCSAVRRLGPEGAKIEENGVWSGRKSKNLGLERSVGSWGSGERFGWNFRQSLAARWSKMDQVGTKLAASSAQESPRCCQDGQLGHFVASFGTISKQFWKLFRVSFCGWVGIAKSMKTFNSPSLLLDFQIWGVIFQLFWARLAQIWALLCCFGFRVRFFADFQRCCAKLATKRGRMGELGRIRGSRWIQEGPGSTREGQGRREPELLGLF